MIRNTKEVLYLKYTYTDQETLEMSRILARNHNDLDDLDAEEAAFKAQIKNRKAGLQVSVQTLSRNISAGYEMRNQECAVLWDTPHVNEVRYVRLDTGEVAKERPMTEQERQMELPIVSEAVLAPVLVMEAAKESADESAANIEAFFGEGSIDALTAQDAGNSAVVDDSEAVFTDPNPDANLEAIKPAHDADWNAPAEAKRRGRPKGSTNKPAADEEDMPF